MYNRVCVADHIISIRVGTATKKYIPYIEKYFSMILYYTTVCMHHLLVFCSLVHTPHQHWNMNGCVRGAQGVALGKYWQMWVDGCSRGATLVVTSRHRGYYLTCVTLNYCQCKINFMPVTYDSDVSNANLENFGLSWRVLSWNRSCHALISSLNIVCVFCKDLFDVCSIVFMKLLFIYSIIYSVVTTPRVCTTP